MLLVNLPWWVIPVTMKCFVISELNVFYVPICFSFMTAESLDQNVVIWNIICCLSAGLHGQKQPSLLLSEHKQRVFFISFCQVWSQCSLKKSILHQTLMLSLKFQVNEHHCSCLAGRNICYLDFLHAVSHRVPIDTLDGRSQTFILEGSAHVTALLLLTAGQHTPPHDI